MSVKQLQRKLDLTQAKVKTRQAELAALKTQAKDLKDQVAKAKAAAKTAPK